MPGERDRQLIEHIDSHIKRIREKTDGRIDILNSDLDAFEIVAFNMLQIGELAKRLSDDFIKENPDIPWKNIKGTRDRIAHGYETIDREIICSIVSEDIPKLEGFCTKILNDSTKPH